MIEARKVAAEEGYSLKKLVEVSLRKELEQRKRGKSREEGRRRWMIVPGEPARDLDVADREVVHGWLEDHTVLWHA